MSSQDASLPFPQSSAPARWERGASRVLASTVVFDVCGVSYRHPVRGSQREFIRLDAPDWVNVVALTREGQVVLVRQFRFGTDEFSLEVPGGVIERGEDPVAAAVRELAEETGFGGGKARLLVSLHPNPAIQGNRCHMVLVEGVQRIHDLDWDADEEIELSTLPLADAVAAAAQGRISHSLSVCALLLAQAQCSRAGV